ncbi:MAG: ERF family protein [Candidatus Moeniiplasma glomeromycotorum]|nr:ERF family protein [Candidatus Moeniiplasma glomeromycotorum]MCE8167484.1 ERF family protein [Candidatus Moeniiplasma glomeromycotorum]
MKEKNNIYTKLQRIQSQIGELRRTEKNKFQNYHFFNELQVLRLLKPLLKEHNLLLLPSDDASQPFLEEKDGKEYRVKYLKKLEIVDREVDNLGEEGRLTFTFWACGSSTDLAKAKGSADTYALKYFLSKFFLIPVKDTNDPDYQTPPSFSKPESTLLSSSEKKVVDDFLKKHGTKI